MTRAEAIALGEGRFWEPLSARQRAEAQLSAEWQCMPIGVFRAALEETLGRPVFLHELAGHEGQDRLKRELFGDRPAPTTAEIVDVIPAEKRIVISPEETP